jgi:hypothetical protein
MRAAAFLTVLSVVLCSAEARAADAFKVHGLTLPNGAVKLGEEDRFRLQETFDAAMKFYKSALRPEKYPRKLIVNQPGLKAVHIENPDPKGEWEGFNLYTYQNETRLFVLARKKTE